MQYTIKKYIVLVPGTFYDAVIVQEPNPGVKKYNHWRQDSFEI